MKSSIMKTFEFEDEIYFRIMCGCGHHEHDINIGFYEDEYGSLSMTLESQMSVSDWSLYNSSWIERKYDVIMWRLRHAFKILFKGYTKTHSDFVLDKNNLEAFEEAIRISKEKFTKKDVKK